MYAARVALGRRAQAATGAGGAIDSRLYTGREAGVRRAGAGTVVDSALSGALRGGYEGAERRRRVRALRSHRLLVVRGGGLSNRSRWGARRGARHRARRGAAKRRGGGD